MMERNNNKAVSKGGANTRLQLSNYPGSRVRDHKGQTFLNCVSLHALHKQKAKQDNKGFLLVNGDKLNFQKIK